MACGRAAPLMVGHVLQTPRTVSSEQLAFIRRVLTTSARPLQPLGVRRVRASARE